MRRDLPGTLKPRSIDGPLLHLVSIMLISSKNKNVTGPYAKEVHGDSSTDGRAKDNMCVYMLICLFLR